MVSRVVITNLSQTLCVCVCVTKLTDCYPFFSFSPRSALNTVFLLRKNQETIAALSEAMMAEAPLSRCYAIVEAFDL